MPSVRRQNAWQQPLSSKGNVEKENHIDTITKFLEDLRKLGEQLSYIQEEQKNLLARMLDHQANKKAPRRRNMLNLQAEAKISSTD